MCFFFLAVNSHFFMLIWILLQDIDMDSSQNEVNTEVTQWRRREATKRLKHLLQLDPSNERALFNLGMLAMDNGDMPSAEHYFKVSRHICGFLSFDWFNWTYFLFVLGIGATQIKFSICSFQFGSSSKWHRTAIGSGTLSQTTCSSSSGSHQRPDPIGRHLHQQHERSRGRWRSNIIPFQKLERLSNLSIDLISVLHQNSRAGSDECSRTA